MQGRERSNTVSEGKDFKRLSKDQKEKFTEFFFVILNEMRKVEKLPEFEFSEELASKVYTFGLNLALLPLDQFVEQTSLIEDLNIKDTRCGVFLKEKTQSNLNAYILAIPIGIPEHFFKGEISESLKNIPKLNPSLKIQALSETDQRIIKASKEYVKDIMMARLIEAIRGLAQKDRARFIDEYYSEKEQITLKNFYLQFSCHKRNQTGKIGIDFFLKKINHKKISDELKERLENYDYYAIYIFTTNQFNKFDNEEETRNSLIDTIEERPQPIEPVQDFSCIDFYGLFNIIFNVAAIFFNIVKTIVVGICELLS